MNFSSIVSFFVYLERGKNGKYWARNFDYMQSNRLSDEERRVVVQGPGDLEWRYAHSKRTCLFT
jgi:hypothetical protein